MPSAMLGVSTIVPTLLSFCESARTVEYIIIWDPGRTIPDIVIGAVPEPEVASLAPGVDGAIATQGQAEVEATEDPSHLDAL